MGTTGRDPSFRLLLGHRFTARRSGTEHPKDLGVAPKRLTVDDIGRDRGSKHDPLTHQTAPEGHALSLPYRQAAKFGVVPPMTHRARQPAIGAGKGTMMRVSSFDRRPNSLRQALVAVLLGTLGWVALVVIPGWASESGQSGSLYIPAMLITAIGLGVLFRTEHVLAACLLTAPALLTAPLTAPRGDGDGLWTLWFPALIVSGVLAAAGHWFGSRLATGGSREP